MRVALLNDIGQPIYHVGDEAMAHAGVAELAARGITDVLLLSRDERHTRTHFGSDVATARTLEFPHDPRESAERLERVRATLAGDDKTLPADDPFFTLYEELCSVDAVVIGGGGNLNSRYGWLLHERAAVGMMAAALGKPLVLSGQSLGPELLESDAEVLRELLASATVVGLRETRSLALARRLCPDHLGLRRCYDDATFVADPPTATVEASPSTRPPLIAATFSSDCGPFDPEEAASVYAALLDALAHRTGGTVEFLPHMAEPGRHDGDEAFHARVAELMNAAGTLQEIRAAVPTAERTATAEYVVTSRYHPAVFGLTGGAAVLPIAIDEYSDVRIQGVLDNWGLADQTVPLAALLTPGGGAGGVQAAAQQWAAEVVEQREAVGNVLSKTLPRVQTEFEQWWDAVVEVLRGATVGPPERQWASPCVVGPTLPAVLRRRFTVPEAPAERPTVLIVMRTKDRPVLLRRALDDVLAQTFTDWQLVVVNDGGVPEPVDELVRQRKHAFSERVTVLHHSRSVGMEGATNRGLRAGDSEFVAVHDDDDQWHPTFLQRTVAYLENPRTTDDGVMVRTEIVYERVEGGTIVEERREIFWPEIHEITLTDLLKTNRGVPISFLYRRAVHGTIGDYDESLPVVGDWEFHMRFLQNFTIGFLDGCPLAFWNQRPGQAGSLGNSVIHLSDAHRKYDLLVRERELKHWTAHHGTGLPLYLTKALEREAGGLHARLNHAEVMTRELLDLIHHQSERLAILENVVADNSFFGFLKRKWRKWSRR